MFKKILVESGEKEIKVSEVNDSYCLGYPETETEKADSPQTLSGQSGNTILVPSVLILCRYSVSWLILDLQTLQ